MPQQIVLAPNVLLVITDEVFSVDLNAIDLYLNQYGTRQQLLFEDGELEERTNSFGYIPNNLNGFDKVLLSPTPNYYPETHFGNPTYHADSLLSNQVVNPLSSNLDFIVCKLMFSSGFGYNPATNALQYLSIQYRGNGIITDLINIYDDYTASKIMASDREIVLNGTVFNSEIEFRLLSIARLQSMTALDAVEINTLLFGSETPEVLHIEYSVMPSTGIVPFVESALNFTKFVPETINTNSLNVSFENNDIDIEISQENGEVMFRMIHTRFNLEDYLQVQGFSFDSLGYELTLTQYDSGNSVVGTTSLFLENILAPFNVITYHPTNLNALVDYIEVSVTGRLFTLDGASIVKLSSIIISDVTPLQGITFDVPLEEYKLTNNVTQNITNVQTKFDAPTIVQVEKPVYVQTFGVAAITLYPVKQVIDINGVYNQQLTQSVEFNRQYSKNTPSDSSDATIANPVQTLTPSFSILQIGTKQYRNIDGSLFRYQVDEYAHSEGASTYMIIDPDNRLITSGGVVNVRV